MLTSSQDSRKRQDFSRPIRERKVTRRQSAESKRTNNYTIKQSESAGLWDISERLQENFQRVEAILNSITDEDDPRAKIEAAAEMRHHIALAQKTLEAASRVEAVRAFENTVMRILEESGAAIRRRVIDRLNLRLKRLDQQSRDAESVELTKHSS